jgi:hypothetical protein
MSQVAKKANPPTIAMRTMRRITIGVRDMQTGVRAYSPQENFALVDMIDFVCGEVGAVYRLADSLSTIARSLSRPTKIWVSR